MIAGAVITKPGLHKHTGSWAIAYGLVSPVVIVDPQTPTNAGFNALVMHEVEHCRARHKLVQILILSLPVLGWILYPFVVRRHELLADAAAYEAFGPKEFRAFLELHKHPTTWWGRWKYGHVKSFRFARTQELVEGR